MSISSVNNDTSLIGVENTVQLPPIAIAPVKAIATIKNPAEIISGLMKKWEENDMYDDDLWNCFREIFENTDFTEKEFSKINIDKLDKLRSFLRRRDVWVNRELNMPISKTLLEIIAESTKSKWHE